MSDFSEMIKVYKENFLECKSDKVASQYCDELDLKNAKNTNKDINTINQLYIACLNADSIAQDINSIKNNTDNVFSDDGMLNSNAITKLFYDKYYVMPKVTYSDVLGNFKNDLEEKDFLPQIKASLNNKQTIFLSAGVGVGKTTFMHKMRYEFCDNQNIIYESMLRYRDKSIDVILKSIKQQIEKNIKDKNIILIIDELDSFSYNQERFIFDKYGYITFDEEIEKTKAVVLGLLSEYSQQNVTIIFSVRPYVMSHFFDNNNQNSPYNDIANNSVIYELKYSNDSINLVMGRRLELMKDILTKIEQDSNVLKGTKKILSEYTNDIIQTFEDINIKIINELYNNSTQGFRSIIELYKSLRYVPALFKSYFSNNILIIYLLSKYKTYSQILPKKCNKTKKFTYPNMFLSVSNSESNVKNPCRNPSLLTYWLKILILKYIQTNENISVKNILDTFSGSNAFSEKKYDRHLIQIALGSLGTTNEYNCLEYNFPEVDIVSYDDFIDKTTISLTRRGRYIIQKDIFFEYNHFELFIDDWQLPIPRIDKIYSEKDYIYKPLKEILNFEYSYEYLSSNKNNKFDQFILNKTKKMIWYTYLFELSLDAELKYYNVPFEVPYNASFFKKTRLNIITSAKKILQSYTINSEKILNDFNTNCENTKGNITNFLNNVLENKVYIICDYNGLCQNQ